MISSLSYIGLAMIGSGGLAHATSRLRAQERHSEFYTEAGTCLLTFGVATLVTGRALGAIGRIL